MSDDDTSLTLRAENPTTGLYDRTAIAKAIDSIEESIGGREAMVAALTAAPPSDDLAYVIGLITDPRNDARKLSKLCKAGNITLGELIEALKRGVYAPMTLKVMATIAERTPAVVEDVFARAVIHEVRCPICRGTKVFTPPPLVDRKGEVLRVFPEEDCKHCFATGFVDEFPDIERQKLALDMANLLPKKGPSVVVDQRSVGMTLNEVTPAGFSKMIAATDQLLHRKRPAQTGPGTGPGPAETPSGPVHPDIDTPATTE